MSQARTQVRAEGLEGISQLAGFGCLVRGWYADSAAIGMHAPGICREAALLAEKNEGFGRVLDYLTEAGPYMALLTAAMPLAMQVLVNHDRLDASSLNQFGVVPKQTLESRAKRQMAELAQAALREQAAAEKAEQDLRNQMELAHQSMNGQATE